MDAARRILKERFGFDDFRPGQEAVVRTLLSGRDAVVVMPTGAGKSLCFQLPALLLEGTALVVSPLIALMKDQVDALTAKRIPATFLNATLSSDEVSSRLHRMKAGRYKLVYVAPERFRNPRFLAALAETQLAFLAIDEAHCISSWGHDFRPDYLHLGEIIGKLPPALPLLAVTATATETVRTDIAEHLRLATGGRGPYEVFVTGFERPNLALTVSRVRTHGEKLERLLRVIEFFRTGIVYCATRKMVERVQALLADHGIHALAYSGGMADTERTAVQDAFMRRAAPVVVATNAFGMGVDRQDIRFVVHWDVPGSLEAYYQEVGRAGRDGLYAWCELLFNYADVRTQEFFIESANPPAEQVYECYAAVRNACAHGEKGEASLSAEAWAEYAGIKSPTTIRNLIALFERNGLLFRTRRVGSPHSIITVPEKPDHFALKAICSALAQKGVADRDRLQEMLDYVKSGACRHRFLLSYFGEAPGGRTCRKCDVCRPMTHFPPRLPLSPKRLLLLQKVLSCIGRLKGAGDYALVAAILRGTAAAEWTRLSTFGLLPEEPEHRLIRICEALEMEGFLSGMRLTAAGYALVHGKTVPDLLAHVPERAGEAREPKVPRPAVRVPRSGLATVLRAWVREEAERRALPPYRVLQNKVIAEIAKKRPTTPAALELIDGMGEIRIAKYGEAILKIVSAYENR